MLSRAKTKQITQMLRPYRSIQRSDEVIKGFALIKETSAWSRPIRVATAYTTVCTAHYCKINVRTCSHPDMLDLSDARLISSMPSVSYCVGPAAAIRPYVFPCILGISRSTETKYCK